MNRKVNVNEVRWYHIVGGWGHQLTKNAQRFAAYEMGYRTLQIFLEGRSNVEEGYV
jgi:hypothetical protein